MGQAKLRGSFEQRRQVAIELKKEVIEANRKYALDYPRRARINHSKRLLLASMIAISQYIPVNKRE